MRKPTSTELQIFYNDWMKSGQSIDFKAYSKERMAALIFQEEHTAATKIDFDDSPPWDKRKTELATEVSALHNLKNKVESTYDCGNQKQWLTLKIRKGKVIFNEQATVSELHAQFDPLFDHIELQKIASKNKIVF